MNGTNKQSTAAPAKSRTTHFALLCWSGFHNRHGSFTFAYKEATLSTTFNTDDRPGGSTTLFFATFPDSTQSICLYSSLPKSGICCALALHGFHTTVEAEPDFSMRTFRRSFSSRISIGPALSK